MCVHLCGLSDGDEVEHDGDGCDDETHDGVEHEEFVGAADGDDGGVAKGVGHGHKQVHHYVGQVEEDVQVDDAAESLKQETGGGVATGGGVGVEGDHVDEEVEEEGKVGDTQGEDESQVGPRGPGQVGQGQDRGQVEQDAHHRHHKHQHVHNVHHQPCRPAVLHRHIDGHHTPY